MAAIRRQEPAQEPPRRGNLKRQEEEDGARKAAGFGEFGVLKVFLFATTRTCSASVRAKGWGRRGRESLSPLLAPVKPEVPP